MTEFLLPCWYRDVEVGGPREQKTLFRALQQLIETTEANLTCNSYIAGGHYHVVLFCLNEAPPSKPDQARLEAAFAPYLPFQTLEEPFLDALVRARLGKEHMILQDAAAGRLHVAQNQYRPLAVEHASLSQEKRNQYREDWIATIKALLAEGKPFIEVFKMTFAGERLTSGFPLPQTDPFQASLFCQMLDHAQLWLWTASARQMYQDLVQSLEAFWARKGWTTPEDQLAYYNTLVTDLFKTEQRYWIEFDEPQPDPLGRVRAVFLYPRYPEQELNRLLDPREDLVAWLQAHQILGQEVARWNIDVIGENASVLLRLSYDTQLACWVLPEDQFMSQVFAWTRWLAITTGMLHKRYARAPQAPDFPTHIASYQTKERVPRKRGKGKPKDKWVTHSRTYIKVTYDVSAHTSRPTMVDPQERENATKRQNWLAQAHPGDLLYEQRIIDTFTRSYPTRKDGTRREGEVTVTHSEPKWVPLLRPTLRKRQVIKKAVASTYEEGIIPSEQETPESPQSRPSSPVSEHRGERREPTC
ncbi:hypothetical protein KSC_002040 [Ktedonobacter sp. SOSP1-52]|uniref:hypothetical protein n=1 Tax=Ktedonobacter sp. SOSP1-52 TaxID=2778366 RepID=UPI001A2FBAF2|nr:hypothetical protein [Ktedonobacter sp. SOSP1-52]GHO61312.1 hypothetical protein KSC_002040 [Ktedonobacter sp. SOSP1-52]